MVHSPAAVRSSIPSYAIIERSVSTRGREPQPASDETRIANRIAERDPAALEEIYARYGRIVFAFLLRTLRDRQISEDVQQQVFLEVWQRAPAYDAARGRLLNWVMTIARSRAIDQLRRRVPEPVGDSSAPVFMRRPEAEVDEIDVLVERYRVSGLLAGLPQEERRLLRMRFYDDLSQTEIAERTGIPLGTVKMRMVDALGRLRERLEEER
jgi:RNA polymerase sigma-70 factor (ECF subfamily)